MRTTVLKPPSVEMPRKKNRIREWVEFSGVNGAKVGTRSHVEANGLGIKIRAVHIDRVLGTEQVRRTRRHF